MISKDAVGCSGWLSTGARVRFLVDLETVRRSRERRRPSVEADARRFPIARPGPLLK